MATPQQVRTEGDIVFVKRVGETQLSDVQLMCTSMAATLAAHGRGFWLFDLSEAAGFGAEARIWAAEWEKKNQVTGLSAFGGTVQIRSMTRLIANAITASSPLRAGFVTTFVDTESEARAWIDEQRALFIARGGRVKLDSVAP